MVVLFLFVCFLLFCFLYGKGGAVSLISQQTKWDTGPLKAHYKELEHGLCLTSYD